MQEIIGQVFGIVAVIFAVISYQMRSQKKLLLVQTVASLMMVLNYALIGAQSGMVMNIMCIVRNMVYSNKRFFSGKAWLAILSVVMAGVGIMSWNGWPSLLMIVGLTINTYALSFEDPQKVRKSILITSPCVLAYDLIVVTIGGMILEMLSIASAAVGIVRFRKRQEV